MVAANSTKDYILYPNEPVDKLTVNRPLANLYSLLEGLSDTKTALTVSDATDSTYGIARMSAYESFRTTDSGDADYTSNALKVGALLDFATNQYASTEFSQLLYNYNENVSTLSGGNPNYNFRLRVGGCEYLQLPNGLNMMVVSLDFGIYDLPVMFGDGAYGGGIDAPMPLSGFDTAFLYDDATRAYLDSAITGSDDKARMKMLVDGTYPTVGTKYLWDTDGTIGFNDCNWTTYSSYRQSYVEVSFSTTVSVMELYGKFYGLMNCTNLGNAGDDKLNGEYNEGFPRRYRPFGQKPVLLSQLAFYNNDSRPPARLGVFDPDDFRKSYDESGSVTERPLTERTAGQYGGSPLKVSPAGGSVVLRGYANRCDRAGNVKDNEVTFDVSMKFFAGSADDPFMERCIREMNARGRVQLMLLGV